MPKTVIIPDCNILSTSNCLQFVYKEGADYICSNSNCPAQVFKRILHWCEVMDIKGLKKSMLARLMGYGLRRRNNA